METTAAITRIEVALYVLVGTVGLALVLMIGGARPAPDRGVWPDDDPHCHVVEGWQVCRGHAPVWLGQGAGPEPATATAGRSR